MVHLSSAWQHWKASLSNAAQSVAAPAPRRESANMQRINQYLMISMVSLIQHEFWMNHFSAAAWPETQLSPGGNVTDGISTRHIS